MRQEETAEEREAWKAERASRGNHAVKLCAPNTPSGNPNRIWLILDAAGRAVGVHDEGYGGDGGFRRDWPGIEPWCVSVDVKAGVVREWRRKDLRQTGY